MFLIAQQKKKGGKNYVMVAFEINFSLWGDRQLARYAFHYVYNFNKESNVWFEVATGMIIRSAGGPPFRRFQLSAVYRGPKKKFWKT